MNPRRSPWRRKPGPLLAWLSLASLLAGAPAGAEENAPLKVVARAEADLQVSPAPNVVPLPSDPGSKPFTEPGLEVSLVAADAFEAEGPVEILFRLRSTGAEAKRVCTVFTPFEKRDRFHLDVRDSQGASALRTGVKQAGPMPQPEDYLELAPGQVVEARVDLRQDHALPPGKYTARFKGSPYVNHLPDSPPLAIEIPSK